MIDIHISVLHYDFSVCKVSDYSLVDANREFTFIAKTDEENSLVCKTEYVPQNVTDRDDNWCALKIDGVLDFSLIGILSHISGILADEKIGIFAVSTFNTDYILLKKCNIDKALSALKRNNISID